MLDIRFIREHPDVVKQDLKKRNDKEKLSWVDDLIKKDEQYRKLLQESEKLRHSRNTITNEINDLKKSLIDNGPSEQINIMEVCGTHTMAISRNGLRQILPETK